MKNILPGNLWKDARVFRSESRTDILIEIGKHKQKIKELEAKLLEFPCVRCGRSGCSGAPDLCDKCLYWRAEQNVARANGWKASEKELERRITAHHCGPAKDDGSVAQR